MKRVLFIVIGVGMLLSGMMAQKMVYLEHCEKLSFDQRKSNAQLLKGNVRFRHEGMLMYCDSAYFYERNNSLDAFGHVRIRQGDSLQAVGETLHYEGNTRLARLQRNVVLTQGDIVLYTDILNYNRAMSVAYYYTGGTIVVGEKDTLTSVKGYFNMSNKNAEFKKKVHLDNGALTLDADSLVYNTASHEAKLVKPTTIVYGDETTILSSSGWYNTESGRGMLYARSRILHDNGNKQLTGDTIFYDRMTGMGYVRGHMELKDTVQKISLHGMRGYFDEHNKSGLATRYAYVKDWSQKEKTFIHADTLLTEEKHYLDSANKDTTYRMVYAYHHVRAYSKEYQFVCDSMAYDSRDSIIRIYDEPVFWNLSTQMSADTFYMYTKDNTLDHVRGAGSVFICKQEGPEEYDQLAGQNMMAYIRNGELKKLHVSGNAETVYYPRNADSSYVGVNKSQSSDVTIFVEHGQLHHVLFTTITTGTMYPVSQIDVKDTRLVGFFWATQERPTSPENIFARPKRTQRPSQKAISATDDEEETVDDTPREEVKRNRKKK